ncbi:MAG TPA: transglutaminase family protein [Polyangiaceae bacterium]|jgi:transglutaminase-like putative cysteine protease|nr:transglutaminase family protein [Polyangiaceae bacterium]
MRYRVTHTTTYAYEEAVSVSHSEARITPRRTPGQNPQRTQLLVEPMPGALVSDTDYFGNTVHFFSLEESHERLTVTAVSDVDVDGVPTPAHGLTPAWESVPDMIRRDRTRAGVEAVGYVFQSPLVRYDASIRAYADESFTPGRPVLDAAYELTRRIYADFAYEPGSTSIFTPLSAVMQARRGVCQDFAHLEIAMLRSLGLPARYVSGYLRTQPAPGRPRLTGADASHAWLSLYCPGFGYIDLDPTNGTIPNDEHVTVAWGRDFGDVSPLKGVILGGGAHDLSVSVDVAAVA